MATPRSIDTRQKNIYLLVDISRTSGRSILTGVFRFAERRPHWKLHVIHVHGMSPGRIVSSIAANRTDGIISSEMEQRAVSNYLESSSIPLVVIGTRKVCIPARKRNVAFVGFEEECIGELAASHLLSLGPFKIFGYVHYTHPVYQYLSSLREQGFRRTVTSRGFHVTTFGSPPTTGARCRRALERWLERLQKPAAVMAGCDERAIDIVEACARLKIDIPKDISLISCDNDDFTCESLKPTLSSIRTSIGEVGYTAARELDALLSLTSTLRKPRRIVVPNALELVERESTSPVPPGFHLTRKALRFIHDNSARDIRVKDVVEHLGVSRRLADLRFREFQHETILGAITRIRLKEVRRRLLSENTSITAIAKTCGFKNPTYLKKVFKDHFKTTMREFRQRNREREKC